MKAVPVWHSTAPEVVYLCRRFELPETPETEVDKEAWLYCASNGVYEVCVNGKSVGRGFGADLTDLPVWNQCDIRDHLHPGDNTVIVRAIGGSASGSARWFMADGGIRTGPRTTLELTTGESWDVRAVAPGPQLPGAVRVSEFYRSGTLPWYSRVPAEGGWDKPSLVDGGGPEPVLWSPPAMVELERLAVRVVAFGEVDADESLEKVEPAPFTTCKCLNPEGLLSPGKRDTVMRGGPPERAVCIILDFGRPVVGFPRLRLKPGTAGTIEIGFSLVLGSVDSVLHYVSAGGREDWQGLRPQHSRYLIIRIGDVADDVVVDCVSMIERRTATDRQGEFSRPDRLAAFWRVGVSSLATRTEVYRRDREPRNWLLEYTLALGDYYVDGGGQRASAILQSSRAPGLAGDDPAPLLAYLLFLDAHSWYHGGGAALRASEAAAIAVGLVADCGRLGRSDGLLDARTGRLGLSALNALYGGALGAALRLCESAGDAKGAARIRDVRATVRRGLQSVWNEARGLFADGVDPCFSQWTNGLMLYFDLVESEQRQLILRGIRGSDVARPDDLPQAFFLVGGLWRSGEQEAALAHVDQHWGRVADREGGSWSEKWDRATGAEVPGPEFFLGSQVLGVRPASPGYEIVEVAPKFNGMLRAAGIVPTRRGTVEVSWDAGEALHLRLIRSETGRTHVHVPRRGRRFPTVTVNDEPVWRNEKFHPNSVAREVVSGDEDLILVTEGTGPYDIEAG